MYLPKHFAMDHASTIDAIDGSGIAQLVTMTPRGIAASTLPLLYVPTTGGMGSLHGHVSRANRQWIDTLPGSEALVLFQGSDAYVSPSAYPTKAETGKVVPTWNYVSVHVRGSLIIHDDPAWTRDLVDRLTAKHEENHASARANNDVTGRAWSTSDAPAEYIDSMVRAIVGIEIAITSIDGKAKLSQNRSDHDLGGVIADLRNGSPSEHGAADRMEVLVRGAKAP